MPLYSVRLFLLRSLYSGPDSEAATDNCRIVLLSCLDGVLVHFAALTLVLSPLILSRTTFIYRDSDYPEY